MASTGEAERAAAGDNSTDPLVDGELEQEINTDFLSHDDSPPSKNIEKEKPKAEREEKKDGMEKLKSTLLVSGVVIAVIGAIFAVAKKIKEA